MALNLQQHKQKVLEEFDFAINDATDWYKPYTEEIKDIIIKVIDSTAERTKEALDICKNCLEHKAEHDPGIANLGCGNFQDNWTAFKGEETAGSSVENVNKSIYCCPKDNPCELHGGRRNSEANK